MTTRRFWTRLGLLLTIPALLLLGACDAFTGSDDDHDDEDDHHERLARVELLARDGTDETLAVWTAEDNEWNVEALPLLEEGGERAVWTVRMFAEDGDEFTLEEGGEYEAQYAIEDGGQDVIYFDDDGEVEVDGEEVELFHGDHIYVYPQNAGTTRIRILLWHDDHAEDDTDFIDLTVEEAGSES